MFDGMQASQHNTRLIKIDDSTRHSLISDILNLHCAGPHLTHQIIFNSIVKEILFTPTHSHSKVRKILRGCLGFH